MEFLIIHRTSLSSLIWYYMEDGAYLKRNSHFQIFIIYQSLQGG